MRNKIYYYYIYYYYLYIIIIYILLLLYYYYYYILLLLLLLLLFIYYYYYYYILLLFIYYYYYISTRKVEVCVECVVLLQNRPIHYTLLEQLDVYYSLAIDSRTSILLLLLIAHQKLNKSCSISILLINCMFYSNSLVMHARTIRTYSGVTRHEAAEAVASVNKMGVAL